MAVTDPHATSRRFFNSSPFNRIGWLIAGFTLLASADIFAAALDTVADRVLGQPNFTSVTANQGGGATGATASTLFQPHGVAVDLQSGRIYIGDAGNHRILSWPNAASFTNGQAADMVIGQADFTSNQPNRGGAAPTAATLNGPRGMKVDSHGNLYVCDADNNRILEYDNPATHDTIADRVIGQADMVSGAPNRGLGTPAINTLNFPGGLAFDSESNLWIADSFNNRVIKVFDPLLSSIGGFAFQVLGQPGYSTGTPNTGGLSASSLYRPFDVALDFDDNLLIADSLNNRVIGYFDVKTNGFTSPSILFGQEDFTVNQPNRGGALDSNTLYSPVALAINSAGRIYISDSTNSRVLELPFIFAFQADRVFGQPNFTTGNPNQGGPSASSLYAPGGLALDASNNLFVAEFFNNRALAFDQPARPLPPRITKLWPASTPAGSPTFTALITGRNFVSASVVLMNASPRPTQLNSFTQLSAVIDASDVAAASDALISVSTPNLNPSGFLALNIYARRAGDTVADAVLGQPDLSSGTINTDGISSRSLYSPAGIAANPVTGRLWVCDINNARVLSWPSSASFANGQAADFILGQRESFAVIFPATADASNVIPHGIAVDAQGNIYVSDARNRVLEFDDPLSTDTVADRVLGQPNFTTTTQNTGGVSASSLSGPRGLALDGTGRLYVADLFNNRVLIYSSPLSSTVADVVIGQPGFASNTQNNGGISARSLSFPRGVAVDSSGRLYVADNGNSRVLEYDMPLTINAAADRVFGHSTFTRGNFNDGGISASSLGFPTSVGVTTEGELYICDSSNNRILEYDHPLGASNAADRVFGQGDAFITNVFNNGGTSARSLANPQAIFVDGRGTLYVSDTQNSRVLAFDRPVNHAPVVTSPIVADPAMPVAGATVHFTATASDIDPGTLSFHWDFGDGSSSDDAAPTHIYGVSGVYAVGVTITDNVGVTVDSSLVLTVADVLNATKLQIKLNFAKPGRDSIALSGTLPVPQGFSAAGQVVTVDVGGVTQSFTLSAKGAAKSGLSSFKLQLKSKKGTVPAQSAKFSASLKGSFADKLADEGLTGTATVKKQPVTVRILVQFNGGNFAKLQQLTYSAAAGKAGSAK